MAKKLDLTGKKYGMLTILEEAEPLILRSGKPRTQWLCRCDCGKEKIVSTQSLTQGTTVSCGCYGASKRIESKRQNIEQQILHHKFGRWTVVESLGRHVQPGGQTRSLWKCVCECGNEQELTTNELLGGGSLSCGCLRKEITSARETKDLSGQKFGRLTAIEISGKKRYTASTTTIWKCKCDCGNEINVPSGHLISGHTTSCGCAQYQYEDLTGKKFGLLTVIKRDADKWLCKCECGNTTRVSAGHLNAGSVISCGCKGSSSGELEVESYLKEANVRYAKEWSFDNLLSENSVPLRFDFALFNEHGLLALVEYQGLQHYVDTGWFGQQQREVTDALKKEYCQQNNIKLFEIRYDENIEEACDAIFSHLGLLQDNSVPSLFTEEGVTTIL